MAGAPAVRLREMAAADIPGVADLWVESWTAAYPALDFEARRPWFADHLEALARSGAHRIVALAIDEIAGLVTIDSASGYLDQLVVGRRFQGGPVAGSLLGRAQELSPGTVTLDVNQDNAPAIRFYAKHGFAVVGSHANARGAPIFRMRWTARPQADDHAASNCSLAKRA